MASLDRIREITTKINDKYFAEKILISFFTNGAVDKTREKIEIEAILTIGNETAKKPDGGMTGGVWHVPVAAAPTKLAIDRQKYPNLTLRRGDKVQAVSRVGKPWFTVATVADRGRNRLYATLNES